MGPAKLRMQDQCPVGLPDTIDLRSCETLRHAAIPEHVKRQRM